MSNFVVRLISEIDGPVKFYKLVINGRCRLDEFWAKHEVSNFSEELDRVQSMLQYISDRRQPYLPKTKFRELEGRKKNDLVKDFEVKTGSLRVYFFKDEIGYIVVSGGMKTSQDSDISRLRKIKKEYLNSKVSKK